jgi:Skp family chaperone for outer membrane proteins
LWNLAFNIAIEVVNMNNIKKSLLLSFLILSVASASQAAVLPQELQDMIKAVDLAEQADNAADALNGHKPNRAEERREKQLLREWDRDVQRLSTKYQRLLRAEQTQSNACDRNPRRRACSFAKRAYRTALQDYRSYFTASRRHYVRILALLKDPDPASPS